MSVGLATLATIPGTFLVEPYIPLGHWIWGVITLAFVLPTFITYGVPWIKRRFRPNPSILIHSEQDKSLQLHDVDSGRMQKAKQRSDQADADFRTFWYDMNTVIARFFTPAPYRKDKSDERDGEGLRERMT